MRFEFGRNWRSYAEKALTPERIDAARADLFRLVPPGELTGRTFLDVGFGQGLSLLLATEAGAEGSGLDIDPHNIRAFESSRRYFPREVAPKVSVGSILEDGALALMKSEGPYDIVHSWGVLHHTGAMYRALDTCASLVKPGGLLVISIYNSHWSSPLWSVIKWTYNRIPGLAQRMLVALLYPLIVCAKFAVTRENPWKKERGMDFYHDVVDWVGGYPYEHATPAEIRRFVTRHGFEERRFYPAQVPTGCNEFVFRRISAAQ